MSTCIALSMSAGALLAGSVAVPASAKKPDKPKGEPLVIGHRGASAYRPEHTLASYQLAIDMGADYIEPDLVSTKDGVLVARHENEISGTTDVKQHPEFADRETTKTIDGRQLTGWFTEDFTLAELKTLRAIERIPETRPANTAHNGLYEVPTLQEVIDLAKREGVGIYPETKHPTYFDSIGLSLEEPLIKALRKNGLDRRNAPVFVQSFEVSNLQELSRKLKVKLVQLTSATGQPYDFTVKKDPRTYADLTTPSGLRWVARYADGIGPDKAQIVPSDPKSPTSLVRDAHRAGLTVHPYTFRPENTFLLPVFRQGNPSSPEFLRSRGNQPAELKLFYKLGVDGLFADNPDTAVAVRHKVFKRR
ncbi:MAG TPA: glycerophosphodiester phosphodiesterase [Solirubrobacter sp.]|nr:glycerophosphodiester phosphodiesterase [Solirubrobacter sp.]